MIPFPPYRPKCCCLTCLLKTEQLVQASHQVVTQHEGGGSSTVYFCAEHALEVPNARPIPFTSLVEQN